MVKISAGLIMYRFKERNLEVLIVHPGGPFWISKDTGAWSIPKGEVNEKENFLEGAKREFYEELGFEAKGNFIELGSVKQKSGKVIYAWAFEGTFDGFLIRQNMIEIEWPYKSGKIIKIPEIDKAKFFDINIAREKLNPAQVEFLERLVSELENSGYL